jgi:hypothetical protein
MTDIAGTPKMIGKTFTRECEPYWIRERYARTGPNHELVLYSKKHARKPVEYELYRILEMDPNMYTLSSDPDFDRLRIRKITTFESEGELYKTIQNDYPLMTSEWDKVENMRIW